MHNILISNTYRNAENTALVNWKWTKGPRQNTYINKEGEIVLVIIRAEQLYAIDDLKVYYGYGWWKTDCGVILSRKRFKEMKP